MNVSDRCFKVFVALEEASRHEVTTSNIHIHGEDPYLRIFSQLLKVIK
jgi:hypothetical protein